MEIRPDVGSHVGVHPWVRVVVFLIIDFANREVVRYDRNSRIMLVIGVLSCRM
uniref:Uncharacterized protein n=1 Tax=Setaria viridis TaxID=4556 RepID=A0A4U6W8G4_SETVI|nr:hypothetical protein SEVIR_1G072366v2 [Setaria viridis]